MPQVACFDTSFHRGQPAVAELVPLPKAIRDAGVQRYGFHGLSYEYIASVLPEVAPEIAEGRVIVAHLGSGASLCALKARKSVDSTLGFTALDGLCMGTRPGSVDPGVILHLFQTLGLSAAEVEKLLYKQSACSAFRASATTCATCIDNPDPAARLAVDYFVYQAAKQIGALAAVLGGVDALVFTAGIGEHSAEIRRRICEASAWLGVTLDPDRERRARTEDLHRRQPRVGLGGSDQRRTDDRPAHGRLAGPFRPSRLTARARWESDMTATATKQRAGRRDGVAVGGVPAARSGSGRSTSAPSSS